MMQDDVLHSIQCALLLLQTLLDTTVIVWIVFVLKWPLIFGDDPGHTHPHREEDAHIHDPNTVLNLALAMFAIDLFEPAVSMWLLPPTGKRIFRLFSLAGLGAAVGCILPLVQLQTGHPHNSTLDVVLYESAELFVYILLASIGFLTKWIQLSLAWTLIAEEGNNNEVNEKMSR